MHAKIHVRTIQPGDQQAVMDLHRDHYWRPYCLLLNPDFYRWQFVEPPDSAAAGGDQSIVAASDDGQILSYLGLVQMSASSQGSPIRAAHLIIWLTTPAARGQGVGKRLMSYVVERFDFLFGRGVTPAALSIYQQLGFQYVKSCSRWIAILDPVATISLAVDPSEMSVKRARARAVHVETPEPFYISQQVPPGAAALSAVVLSDSLAFDRTQAYLAWRYERHPFLRYVFLSLGDPAAPEGIAVLRVEDVRGRPGKTLRILEFIAAADQSKRLGEAVLAYGFKHGCAYADIFGVCERFVAGFVTAGGFNAIEEPDLRLPYLLQPWDPDIEPPGVLFFGRRGAFINGGISLVDDITRIYASKGDGNMDWPSWVPTDEGDSIAPPTWLAKVEGKMTHESLVGRKDESANCK
jgi:GNAT superfamily N-acetyltransferase